MICRSAKFICLLAAAFCLPALADRLRWTDPMWAKIWPRVVLSRRPSPTEARAAELKSDLEIIQQKIDVTRGSLGDISNRRRDLRSQLRVQLGVVDDAEPLSHLQAKHPIVFALVRSIDAEEGKEKAALEELALLEAEAARLQARRIAAESGIPLVETLEHAGPADQLKALAAESDAESRYQRIIQEARHNEQDKERI